MTPPDVHIEPQAHAVLAATLARHPRRRIRIRHDGYG